MRSSQKPRKATGRANGGKRAGPKRQAASGGFSGRSFGIGTFFGAALALALIYGPDLLAIFAGKEQADAPPGQPTTPALTYEFMNLLPNEEVVTGVVPFAAAERREDVPETPEQAANAPTVAVAAPAAGRAADIPDATEYLLQAASFRSRDEADALRAELLLDGMAAAVNAVTGPAGAEWHRVMVGPFAGRAEMERHLTRLRSKDIAALPVAPAR